MDVYMPGMGGLEAARLISRTMPSVQIVMLTVSEEDQDLFEALKAGAHGYLLKSVEPEELFRTLRGIVRGDAFLTPSMATKLVEEFKRRSGAPAEASARHVSPRELEVLELLIRGAVNKEIAAALHITENTVKNHLKSIMEKLNVENRVQAVAYALRARLVRRPKSP